MLLGLKKNLRCICANSNLLFGLAYFVFMGYVVPTQAAICFLPDCADKVVEDVKDDSAEKCKAEGYENYQNRVCH